MSPFPANFVEAVPLNVGLVCSLLANFVIAQWRVWHFDSINVAIAPQHVHAGAVPRMGGVAILFAMLVAGLATYLVLGEVLALSLAMSAAAPVFVVGQLEDIRGNISPAVRYGATAISAYLLVAVFDLEILRYDFFVFDALVEHAVVSALLSVFCIAGVTQSFNIIDGKNGLSSGMALLALVALLLVARHNADREFVAVAAMAVTAIMGFWLVNILTGRVFLGDAGAYLIGFVVAAMAVAIVARNPLVSPWLPFVAALYPITETLFTMTRRIGFEGNRFSEPDHLHMHSLIYRRLMSGRVARLGKWTNSLTSLILLGVSLLPAIVAVCWSDDSSRLKGMVAVYVLLYTFAYLVLRRKVGDAPAPS